eukprot:TRINITY_DN780_c0_g3_i1.p1 TRINITY_DN780_c0_g3~~TRINITY_DN780_c0_g3_i1.p1  ORF type:complete len:376 (-),score=176.69 TRINITY_DN780_c0_g3_i1:671-1798(-)
MIKNSLKLYNLKTLNLNRNRQFIRYFSSIESPVLFENRNGNHLISLNRPKALNALNLDMIKLLYPYFQQVNKDSNSKVIIQKGLGGKAFCAGGDIVTLCKAKLAGLNDKEISQFFSEEYQLNHLIANLNIPHVAILNGVTMGGGVGLSVHGKYRIATENTLFAMPETAIGFFCDVGGSYFLPRLQGNLGMYLGLTGARLKGYDVKLAGIATHFVSSDKILDLENQLLQVNSANEVDQVLQNFNESKNQSLNELIDNVEKHFSKNSVEQIIESLQSNSNEWSNKTLNSLRSVSPTSLKVVYQQLNYGSKLDLAECLKMEFRMVHAFLNAKDFFEGVRALLIDKDNKPNWLPARLEQISDNDVQQYFKYLGENELKF